MSIFRKAPPPPAIPPFVPPKVTREHAPDPGIEVTEETWQEGAETEAMSRTGQFRAWVKSKLRGEKA